MDDERCISTHQRETMDSRSQRHEVTSVDANRSINLSSFDHCIPNLTTNRERERESGRDSVSRIVVLDNFKIDL